MSWLDDVSISQRTDDSSIRFRIDAPRRRQTTAALTIDVPILDGKTSSSSSRPCTHVMSASTYCGAESAVGFLYVVPSSNKNSYL
jgi:hypothetical protein